MNDIKLIPIAHEKEKRDLPTLLHMANDYLMFVAICATYWIMRYHPDRVYWLCLVLVVTLTAYRLWLRRYSMRSKFAGTHGHMSTTTPDDSDRLVCYGDPSELALLQELQDLPFEPQIERRRSYLRRGKQSRKNPKGLVMDKTAWIILIVGLGLLILGYPFLAFATMSIIIAIPVRKVSWLTKHLYYRVIPQRLDILEFKLLSAQAKPLQSIDLSTASVTCRFDTQVATIDGVGGEERLEIDLASLRSPHSFVKYMFWAAICTTQVAPLPQHELLG